MHTGQEGRLTVARAVGSEDALGPRGRGLGAHGRACLAPSWQGHGHALTRLPGQPATGTRASEARAHWSAQNGVREGGRGAAPPGRGVRDETGKTHSRR